ncbi:MAG: terpene cyclase/mutase family protein, partial [Isosphaeraceae bacterium]|nr:terpene cyclase/mutase family protein [Isosphaeraceae bacterium]
GQGMQGVSKAIARAAGEMTAPFSGRQGAAKAKLVRREGGSVESERAVERGLDWLGRHQRSDGSWSLDYRKECSGKGCPPDKHVNSDTAATGLALLPMLGAGQTHTEPGRYQKAVKGGLDWLLKVQKPNGDLRQGGGNMYSHAIASMALCEAYGITKDERLKEPAQRAINFIVKAQNPDDGGWRYQPGQPGDTSVFGWQMFALRSGYLAGLEVPETTIQGCRKYLDKAAVNPEGSVYSYQPGKGPSPVMSAEALLGRQYLGWPRDYPPLVLGTERVAANLLEGRERNIYYWYYGTQLLHNMQGPAWKLWNLKIRDGLVATQVTRKGCDYGSWDPEEPAPDHWGKTAGRFFVTSLSILTLEVYYRYLPLYRERDLNPVGGRATAKAPKE